ncbi:MAG: ATP synthase F1 subunit epsilon [Bacteroidales bacterium]|nr:ATP synthase F1 subunit epsilon [Bacteroidales bacterium]
MKLEVITPDKELYKGEIKLIQVPGAKGSFEILNNHAPIISTLDKGTIKIIDNLDKPEFIEILGGVIEVKRNHIIVLADIV